MNWQVGLQKKDLKNKNKEKKLKKGSPTGKLPCPIFLAGYVGRIKNCWCMTFVDWSGSVEAKKKVQSKD